MSTRNAHATYPGDATVMHGIKAMINLFREKGF